MISRRYLLTPWLIRAMIPEGTIGTYTLWSADAPIYIGRSDTCLRRRLLEHAAVRADDVRFTFDVSRSIQDAFAMECSLFHALGDVTSNIDHPPRARRTDPACPFCQSTFTAVISNRLSSATLTTEGSNR